MTNAKKTTPESESQLRGALTKSRNRLREIQQEFRSFRAAYDAAQTFPGNQNHWGKADTLSPDMANSLEVRSTLRSRSRFEIIENNPFLKGTIRTLCNDFAGSGPRIRVVDSRIDPLMRREIESRWNEWADEVNIRKTLWTMRMDKAVAGESFMFPINRNDIENPVKLGFKRVEADCVTSPIGEDPNAENQIDGVLVDGNNIPLKYYVWNYHPGGDWFWRNRGRRSEGRWYPAKRAFHWFDQEREWIRGIPELTPSLPLCSVLRRYTLAMVRHAELQAKLSAVLESEYPAQVDRDIAWDAPMEEIPVENGMLTVLPWGMKMHDYSRVANGQMYDAFVGAVLREIIRPLLIPYNIAVGTTKDSNMASAVVDADLYDRGQRAARLDWNISIGLRMFSMFWHEGVLIPNYFGSSYQSEEYARFTPRIAFQHDRVTLMHTDPQKRMSALATAVDNGFMTIRDVQEEYFGRDYEAFQSDLYEDQRWRQTLPLPIGSAGAAMVQNNNSTDNEDNNNGEE